jgi:hypothetical protein
VNTQLTLFTPKQLQGPTGRGRAGARLHQKLKKGGASARTPRSLARLGALCLLCRQALLAPQAGGDSEGGEGGQCVAVALRFRCGARPEAEAVLGPPGLGGGRSFLLFAAAPRNPRRVLLVGEVGPGDASGCGLPGSGGRCVGIRVAEVGPGGEFGCRRRA